MRDGSPTAFRAGTAALIAAETPSPYLHDRGTAVYNPLSGATLEKASEGWAALSRIASGKEPLTDPAVLEHLHVTATAKAVLCCQDYYEILTVGDLKSQTVAELLGGETMARLRRWTYGVEEAPADFLCRRCEFALEG